VHSENGFGSSGIVPGAADANERGARGSGRSGQGGDTGKGSGNGAGAPGTTGNGVAPGLGGVAGVMSEEDLPPGAARASARPEPSQGGTYVLIAALLAAGLLSGVAAARGLRAAGH
jgi:hypothetical protein